MGILGTVFGFVLLVGAAATFFGFWWALVVSVRGIIKATGLGHWRTVLAWSLVLAAWALTFPSFVESDIDTPLWARITRTVLCAGGFGLLWLTRRRGWERPPRAARRRSNTTATSRDSTTPRDTSRIGPRWLRRVVAWMRGSRSGPEVAEPRVASARELLRAVESQDKEADRLQLAQVPLGIIVGESVKRLPAFYRDVGILGWDDGYVRLALILMLLYLWILWLFMALEALSALGPAVAAVVAAGPVGFIVLLCRWSPWWVVSAEAVGAALVTFAVVRWKERRNRLERERHADDEWWLFTHEGKADGSFFKDFALGLPGVRAVANLLHDRREREKRLERILNRPTEPTPEEVDALMADRAESARNRQGLVFVVSAVAGALVEPLLGLL